MSKTSRNQLSETWDINLDYYPNYIEALHKGIISVAPGVQTRYDGVRPWHLEHDNPTMMFRLHSFGSLAQLVSAWVVTHDPSLQETAVKMLSSWISSVGTPDESPVWHGHQTALRASVLAKACGVGLVDTESFSGTLRVHANFLEDGSNYDGAWNHGIDQCIALLDLARVVELPSSQSIAIDRILDAIPELVDEEGVVAEQATHYAGYVYSRLRVVEDRLTVLGVELPREFSRVELIPEFLVWATRPDGLPVQIGDTPRGPMKTADPEALLRSPENGVAVHPVGSARIYRDGWAFVRSGWKGWEQKDPTLDSLLTVRYGTFRRIHGHRDHMSVTWYARGKEIICDPGFSGYGNKKVREYELLEEAHNGPVVDGAGKFKWMNGTVLETTSTSTLSSGDPIYTFSLVGKAYELGSRRRTIIHAPTLELLVIWDGIYSRKPVSMVSNWIIGNTFKLVNYNPSGRSLMLRGGSADLEMRAYSVRGESRLDIVENDSCGDDLDNSLGVDVAGLPVTASTGLVYNPIAVVDFGIRGVPLHIDVDREKATISVSINATDRIIVNDQGRCSYTSEVVSEGFNLS